MLIISIRTDKPEAEITLHENTKLMASDKWLAHRELSTTIHLKLEALLTSQQKDWPDIKSIVFYKGPGSFTGLRIGLSVANALAYSYQVPIVSSSGEQWISEGLKRLESGENEKISSAEYGQEPHITRPRK